MDGLKGIGVRSRASEVAHSTPTRVSPVSLAAELRVPHASTSMGRRGISTVKAAKKLRLTAAATAYASRGIRGKIHACFLGRVASRVAPSPTAKRMQKSTVVGISEAVRYAVNAPAASRRGTVALAVRVTNHR